MFDLTWPAWESLLIGAGYTAIIASGLYFSNSAGVLSVASAAIAGMGGYLAAVLTTNFGWPFISSLVAAMLLGTIVGAVLAAATLRMSPLVAGLTTLAFGEAIAVIAFNTDYIGGAQTFTGIPPLTQLWQVAVALAAILGLGWRFQRSTLGLAACAVRDNPQTAAAMGIDVPRVKILVFALGSAIIGLGGAFRAHYVLVVSPADLGFWNSVNYAAPNAGPTNEYVTCCTGWRSLAS
jgi:branched-chain amino acid transport system permease protein